MTDRNHGFDMAARGFVAAWDRLGFADRESFSDLPAKADVRPVMNQAEQLRDQRPNPALDFTIRRLCVIDLADSFLRWLPGPGDPARWDAMFAARAQLGD